MKAFVTLEAKAMPLDLANVDTDQIIPARFLGLPRPDQVDALFRDLRFEDNGEAVLTFPMNQTRFSGSKILVVGNNFGCGSSRENAVTTLLDNGFECIIAPSFGDIFYNNCLQNGVLPIVIQHQRVVRLFDLLTTGSNHHVWVDLENQSLKFPDGTTEHFDIDSFRKSCLLKGLDAIDLTLSYSEAIEDYEKNRFIELEWQV